MAILDSASTAVVQYKYDAWGRPISCLGTMASTLGKINPFRYRGYVYDEETGLYYLRSRYFAPNWCRFINADAEIIEKNLFTYCLNNPIRNTDQEGTHTVDRLMDGEPEDPESDAIKGGGLGAGGNSALNTTGSSGTRFNSNVSALHELSKPFVGKGKGVTMSDAEILTNWAREYGVNYHDPMMHPNRTGIWSYTLHIKIMNLHIAVFERAHE